MMDGEGVLLDTNVLSELERPHPSSNALAFIRHTTLDRILLSDVVLAEIRFGIETAHSASRRDTLAKWLKDGMRPCSLVASCPSPRIFLFRWRWIVELSRPRRHTFDQSDALLAATAIHHDLVVVTRDIKPFLQVDVAVLDPWQPH